MSKDKKEKKAKKPMSEKSKWIITWALAAIAVLTVILCAANGSFHFEPGSVQPHDIEVIESQAPEQNDEGEDEDSNKHTIFISAGNGGKAEPNGSVAVDDWGTLKVKFTEQKGYELKSITVDGKKVSGSSYTFKNVTEDHTIMATFEKLPEPTPTPTPTPEPTTIPEPTAAPAPDPQTEAETADN